MHPDDDDNNDNDDDNDEADWMVLRVLLVVVFGVVDMMREGLVGLVGRSIDRPQRNECVVRGCAVAEYVGLCVRAVLVADLPYYWSTGLRCWTLTMALQ